MDKLQPQTVYVPVDVWERLPIKPVPVIYYNGRYNAMTPERIKEKGQLITHWLEKQEGVYPLTGKELDQLLLEYSKCNTTIKEFLKSKGIEI